MNTLAEILDTDKVEKVENDRLYHCLTESESSKFYSELFSDSFKGTEKPDLYHEVKKKHQQQGEACRIVDEILAFLKQQLSHDSCIVEIGGGVHQQRSGDIYKYFEHYYPIDISDTSIRRYTEKYGRVGIVADAKILPFKTNSIDCILTHTFLEHPLEPENVLKEIVRVLKPGGIIIHNDAWFCRWWQRYGVVGLKTFRSMSLDEKLIWLGAKITEFPLFRIPPIIARRFIQEVFSGRKQNIKLRYKKLSPNYDLHLGCDEDAANRIDPIDVVRFYESRDFHLVNELSFVQRLLYPNRYIVLRKGSNT